MRTKLTSKIGLAGASVLALAVAAPTAVAQEDAAGADEDRRLSTVTVTATQRTESIQDVPIAVTALDPQTLERSGVADVTSLDSVAPSFNMNSSDTATGGTTLRIRGVGTTGNNIGLESSVGVFLDGVYLSRPGVALGDLMDLEQIEVLRGPQGTLFGRNTSAGALNIKTKKPNLEEFEGFGTVTLGNYNLVNVQGGVSVPLIEDTLALRISGAIRERDGLIRGIGGTESHDRDRSVFRGQLYGDFGDKGTVRAILDYSEANEQCCHAVWNNDTAFVGFFGPAGLPADGGAPFTGPDALEDLRSNDSEFGNPFEQTGFSLEYNVDTPIGDLTYIGAYRDFEDETFRSTDYTSLDIFTVGRSPEAQAAPGSPFTPGGNVTEIETITHELRLQGAAFDDRLDWLVGLYYSDETIESRGSLTLLDEYQSGVSAGLLGQPANVLLAFAGGNDANGDFASNAFLQEGESFSIFTHNILSLTDNLDLTVGLRYVEESKEGSFEQLDGNFDACLGTFNTLATNPGAIPSSLVGASVALNCFVFAAPVFNEENFGPFFGAFSGSGLDALLPQEFDDTFDDEELVYTVKLGYSITPDINVYGGFTHGFKSGGFNLDASAAAGGADPRFDSELVDAWELGLKSTLFDGRARANVAVFHQDLEGFQVLEFTGIRFQTFNVGKAKATGVEVETEAQLTNNLSANFNWTYSDARYPNNCDVLDPADPAFNPNAANLCGNTLTNAPENVIVAGATYESTFENFNWFANANLRYESDRRTSTQPTELLSDVLLPGDIQDSNTKVNLRVGVSSPDDRWTVEIWGRNVTDEITKNVTFNIPLRGGEGNRARGQFTQDPATYGVTLRTKF
ncbi:MAG: TonB-dependent receptor [Henriciella sp.]|nr:TonB-dependent receptor [Henriciella sp.]